LPADSMRGRRVGGVGVSDEVERATEVAFDERVVLLRRGEALRDLLELLADSVLLALEEVEVDGPRVVSL